MPIAITVSIDVPSKDGKQINWTGKFYYEGDTVDENNPEKILNTINDKLQAISNNTYKKNDDQGINKAFLKHETGTFKNTEGKICKVDIQFSTVKEDVHQQNIHQIASKEDLKSVEAETEKKLFGQSKEQPSNFAKLSIHNPQAKEKKQPKQETCVATIVIAATQDLFENRFQFELKDELSKGNQNIPHVLTVMGLEPKKGLEALSKAILDRTSYNLRLNVEEPFHKLMREGAQNAETIKHVCTGTTRSDKLYVWLPKEYIKKDPSELNKILTHPQYEKSLTVLKQNFDNNEQLRKEYQNAKDAETKKNTLQKIPKPDQQLLDTLHISEEEYKDILCNQDKYLGIKKFPDFYKEMHGLGGDELIKLLFANIKSTDYKAFWGHDLLTTMYALDQVEKNYKSISCLNLITDPGKDVDDAVTLAIVLREFYEKGTVKDVKTEKLKLFASVDEQDKRFNYIKAINFAVLNNLYQSYQKDLKTFAQENDGEKIKETERKIIALSERMKQVVIHHGSKAASSPYYSHQDEKGNAIAYDVTIDKENKFSFSQKKTAFGPELNELISPKKIADNNKQLAESINKTVKEIRKETVSFGVIKK